jgi:Na+-driven multidrug efflux pump
MITLGFQSFYLARGKSWVVLISAIITASTNILFDYLLIFGIGIFPEMGVAGAATASSIADGLGMVFLVIFTISSKENKSYNLFGSIKGVWFELKELISIGTPLLLQGFSALFTWTLFFTWIEQMGKYQLTVSQNIRSIYFLAFVPIWGFAGTTKTYISQYIGRKEFHSIKKIQKRIQFLTILFLFFFFHGALFYPEVLIKIVNPNELYAEKSAEILRFVAVSIFLYGTVSVYFQTINGSGNTMASFIIEVICVAVYMTSAYLFIKVFKFDIYLIWSVEYIYFGMLGFLSIAYLYFFKWQKKTYLR